MRSMYVDYFRCTLCALTFFLLVSCQKDEIRKNDDPFVEQAEQLTELKAEVLSAGNEFIEVQWNKIYNTHFKAVSYSVFLGDKKIVEGLSTNKYSLINLEPGKEYSIKIVATTEEGKQTGQVLMAGTVPLKVIEPSAIIRKEYKIHSYSAMTGPAAIRKFAAGGHLIVTYLQHPSSFPDGGHKVIIFRTDPQGNLLWYRLMPTVLYRLQNLPQISLTLGDGEKEGVMFLGSFAFKISVSEGKILLEKDYGSIVDPAIQTLFSVSPQQLLIGTGQGSLLSISPQDLSVQWQNKTNDALAEISSIKVDSKKNIYAIRRNYSAEKGILIEKYSPQGEYLSKITPEGGDSGTAIAVIDAADNLYVFSFSAYSHNLYYSKFNDQGILIKRTTISDAIASPSPFFNNKKELVVYGRYEGSDLTTYTGIFVFDAEMNVKSKRYLTEIPYHIVRGITENPDGSFNLFLYFLQTYTYENRNFVFIKTDADGKI